MKKYLLAIGVISALSACTGHSPTGGATPDNGTNSGGDVTIGIEKASIGTDVSATNQDLMLNGNLDFGSLVLGQVVSAPEKKIILKNNTGSPVHLVMQPIASPFQLKINRCPSELAANGTCTIIVRAIPRNQFKSVILDTDFVITNTDAGVPSVHINLQASGGVTGAGLSGDLTGPWSASIEIATLPDGSKDNFRRELLTYTAGTRPKFKSVIITNTSLNKIPAGALAPKLHGDIILRSNNCNKDLYPQEKCSLSVISESKWRNGSMLESGVISISSSEGTTDERGIELTLGLPAALDEFQDPQYDANGGLYNGLYAIYMKKTDDNKLIMACNTGVFPTLNNSFAVDFDMCKYDPATKTIVKYNAVSGVTSVNGYPKTLGFQTGLTFLYNNKYYMYINEPGYDSESPTPYPTDTGTELFAFDLTSHNISLVQEINHGYDVNGSIRGSYAAASGSSKEGRAEIAPGKYIVYAIHDTTIGHPTLDLLDLNKSNNQMTTIADPYPYPYNQGIDQLSQTNDKSVYVAIADPVDGLYDIWKADETGATKVVDYSSGNPWHLVQMAASTGSNSLYLIELSNLGEYRFSMIDTNGAPVYTVQDMGRPDSQNTASINQMMVTDSNDVYISVSINSLGEYHLFKWNGSHDAFTDLTQSLFVSAESGASPTAQPGGYNQVSTLRSQTGSVIYFDQSIGFKSTTWGDQNKVYTFAYDSSTGHVAVMSPDVGNKAFIWGSPFGLPMSGYIPISAGVNPQQIGNYLYFSNGSVIFNSMAQYGPQYGIGKILSGW